jgi:TolB protein
MAALSKYPHRETTIAVYRRAVTRVIAHLTANLGDDHTLEDMADVATLSPFHFNRIFREIAGVSPVRYLYALRIAEAERLILTTRLKVIDICYSVGYNSLGSFNKRFVSLVGYSPRRIRSLATSVDPAELRRLIDARADSGALDRRGACSIWGTTHVPPGFSGVAMVALFPGPPSNNYPIASVLPEQGAYVLPPVRQAGDFCVMAVGLTWHEQMVDFLLQPNCLRAIMPPIHLSAGGRSSPIDFHLAPREPVDPPIPPSLAFRLVDQFIRLPDELPDELPEVNRRGATAVLGRGRLSKMSFTPSRVIKPARLLAALLALIILGMPSRPGQAAEFTFRLVASDPTSGADASISPDGTMFATSSRRDGHQNIWLYDIAATRWRKLTEGDGSDSEPSWSPDGSRIAFASTRGGDKAIWTVRLADGVLTRITTERADVDYPAWSPDGSSIVYSSGPWKARTFKTIASTAGNPRNVSKKPGHLGACRYYPDGRSLICHTYENDRGNVIRLSLDGVVLDHLTNGALDYKPAVSPDGNEVAFSRIEDGTSVIQLSPASSIRPTRISAALTQPPGEDRWPMYTQSGRLFFHRVVTRGTAVMVYHRSSGEIETLIGSDEKPSQAAFDSAARRVAYCAELDGRSVVRILDRATGLRRTLDLGGREACFPRFAPDDRTIAVTVKTDGVWQIAVVDAEGSEPRVLTDRADLHGLNGPLDWSPDGERLLFKADTAPFESALFVLDTRSATLERVTRGHDFFEAPSWSPDGGAILFMSTHSGEWLWGLYRLTLSDRRIASLAPNDSTEKNYPRLLADGRTIWMQADRCDATEFVVERDAAGREQSLTKMPGGHWPSYSRDGDQLLFTAMLRNVEFWLGDRIEASVR